MVLIAGKSLLAVLATAALTLAAPLNAHGHDTPSQNSTILPRADTFGGTVNFFKREDCQNACVENGMCLSGQTTDGDLNPLGAGSWDSWGGKTCWDLRPGTKSIALTQGDGWGYTWSDQTCKVLEQEDKDPGFWDHVKGGKMASGREDAKCSLTPEGMVSLNFDWMKRKEMLDS